MDKMKDFVDRKEWQQGSYSRQKAGWVLEGYFILGDGGIS